VIDLRRTEVVDLGSHNPTIASPCGSMIKCLSDHREHLMKQDRELEAAPHRMTAPELVAPPGLEYSDGIACYQIAVAFRGNPEALQRRMPSGWKLADNWGQGPRGSSFKGANVVVGFHDTLIESKKLSSKTDLRGRFVIFAAMGYNESTGARGPMSFIGFTADAANVPGKYNDKVLVESIDRKLSLQGDSNCTKVAETFDVKAKRRFNPSRNRLLAPYADMAVHPSRSAGYCRVPRCQ